ncbi:MAG: hypothetical protein JKX85_01260 [Phycisphaeraceae bacterium]|nr:hypothetical protein [Phycisphaeraceae bacterium]
MTLLGDEEWVKWSNREIGRRCGVSDKFVGNVRKESSLRTVRSMDSQNRSHGPESTVEDSPERTFTHHKTGKPATMKVGNIGQITVDDLPDDVNWNDDVGALDDPEDAGIEDEEPPEPELILPDEPEAPEFTKPSLAVSTVDLMGNVIRRKDVAQAFEDSHLISDATKALRAFRTTQRKLIKDQHPLSAMIHQSLDRTITDCIHDIEDVLPYCVIPDNVPKDEQNKKHYRIGWLTKRQHANLPSDWK